MSATTSAPRLEPASRLPQELRRAPLSTALFGRHLRGGACFEPRVSATVAMTRGSKQAPPLRCRPKSAVLKGALRNSCGKRDAGSSRGALVVADIRGYRRGRSLVTRRRRLVPVGQRGGSVRSGSVDRCAP